MKFVPILILLLLTAACEPLVYEDQRVGEKPAEKRLDDEREDTKQGKTYRVVGISDGDSIRVIDDDNKEERVRLATIDAPENGQPFGKPAKQSLSDMIFKKRVQIVGASRDQYGRIIGEVYIGDLNANVEQLRKGYAWYYRRHQNQQSAIQRKVYSAAENSARNEKAGLWKDKNPTPPWEYRKRNRR